MRTTEKLCPFRRTCGRSDKAGELKYFDRFGKCLGEKCMAYSGGECLRLHQIKEVGHYGKEEKRGAE